MIISLETSGRIEPCLLDEPGMDILDLVTELSGAASTLASRLHPRSARSLSDLVRMMNCYYSNLIEGHNTTLREIERALAGELENAEDRRNLQIEAQAHVRLQREIDNWYNSGHLPEPASVDFIRELHRQFYKDAPEDMLAVHGNGQHVRMTPGQIRRPGDPEIQVGRHLPPSGTAVEACMNHFESRYRLEKLRAGGRILAMAVAHHRLNYIHPFLDGNGHVSRLMSHAMGLQAGIGAHGLWSISRGLARGIESRNEYKMWMQHADMPRQGDLDGRGNLSQRALAEFTTWFLKVCLDQVTFMGRQFALDTLAQRLKFYAERHSLNSQAFALLEQILYRGEMPRGDAPAATGLKIRAARDVLGSLIDRGIVASDTPKGPVSLRFPLNVAEILFPELVGRI